MWPSPLPARRVRAGLLLAATAAALTACGGDPATGDQLGFANGVAPPAEGISRLEVFLFYVVAPLGIMVVIAVLVLLPGIVRGSRYRPGRGWSAPPLWFGGPADPVAAVEAAETDSLTRGGASGSW